MAFGTLNRTSPAAQSLKAKTLPLPLGPAPTAPKTPQPKAVPMPAPASSATPLVAQDWPVFTFPLSESDLLAQKKSIKSLHIESMAQALLCVPSAYDDLRHANSDITSMQVGQRSLIALRLTSPPQPLDESRQPVSHEGYEDIWSAPYKRYWEFVRQVRFHAQDAAGNKVMFSMFGGWNLRLVPRSGSITLEAELQSIPSPGQVFYLRNTKFCDALSVGRIYARYQGPGSTVAEEAVRTLVCQAFSDPGSMAQAAQQLRSASMLRDAHMLPLSDSSWESIDAWLLSLHRPKTLDEGKAAAQLAKRIAIEAVRHISTLNNTRTPHPKSPLLIQKSTVDILISSQQEKLTGDQATAVCTITQALQSPTPANILLSGDVGTGKSLVFVLPAVAAHMVGAQVAMMCPTEILANQLYNNISKRFPDAKVQRVFAGQKSFEHDAILIGTSGLGTVASKQGWIPHVLVIDEQHKLSSKDRSHLLGAWTHLIEASATPVPRSMASSLFGGVTIVTLEQAPVPRAITSQVFDDSKRNQISTAIKHTLSQGARILIVYPAVVSSGNSDRANLQQAFESMSAHMPDKVAMIHGKLDAQEIEQTLHEFREGKKQVLLASTIVETGIDVPDIRLMIVRNADNFGIAQLHQLRGRLCRNGGEGLFIMHVKDESALPPQTQQRLNTVATIKNGFLLAEADMESRGFGDMLGQAQSGSIQTPLFMLDIKSSDFVVPEDADSDDVALAPK